MANLVFIADEQAELIAGGDGRRHRRPWQSRGSLVSLNFPELKSNDGGISISIYLNSFNGNTVPVG